MSTSPSTIATSLKLFVYQNAIIQIAAIICLSFRESLFGQCEEWTKITPDQTAYAGDHTCACANLIAELRLSGLIDVFANVAIRRSQAQNGLALSRKLCNAAHADGISRPRGVETPTIARSGRAFRPGGCRACPRLAQRRQRLVLAQGFQRPAYAGPPLNCWRRDVDEH